MVHVNCLCFSVSRNFLWDAIASERRLKLSITLLDSTLFLQCSCYHSTPVLWKKLNAKERKKVIMIILNFNLLLILTQIPFLTVRAGKTIKKIKPKVKSSASCCGSMEKYDR